MTNQIKPIVEVINNKAITYSTNIAEVFNKSHDDLFRKISKLEKDVRKNTEMFQKVEYIDTYGRKQPCYQLNRDGVVLLIMGFTGKKALEFKLKYIEAFNAMEAKLKSPSNNLKLIASAVMDELRAEGMLKRLLGNNILI